MSLLVNMYRYKDRHPRIVLGEPLPELPPPPAPTYKNIVAQPLKVRDFLAQDPQRTYKDASWHFRVTRARISQLMKITRNLPEDFIALMINYGDQKLLKRFSGKTLSKIARVATIEERRSLIENHLKDLETH